MAARVENEDALGHWIVHEAIGPIGRRQISLR